MPSCSKTISSVATWTLNIKLLKLYIYFKVSAPNFVYNVGHIIQEEIIIKRKNSSYQMRICVWRKLPEKHDCLLTCKLDPASWSWATGGSSHLPVLRCVPPTLLVWGATLMTQPWGREVVRRPSGRHTCCSFKASVWAPRFLADPCGDLPILWMLTTSLTNKFPCLLKLPLANLEWPASFFGIFLHPVSWGQFQISAGKFPRFHANNWWVHQENEVEGLGKEASLGKIPGGPWTSIWGGQCIC